MPKHSLFTLVFLLVVSVLALTVQSCKHTPLFLEDDGQMMSSTEVRPFQADVRKLFKVITEEEPDEQMPQVAGPLPACKIDQIKAWVDAGAPEN